MSVGVDGPALAAHLPLADKGSFLRIVMDVEEARYFIQRLSADGTIDLARIAQSEAALDRRGEGLAQAFDVDAF